MAPVTRPHRTHLSLRIELAAMGHAFMAGVIHAAPAPGVTDIERDGNIAGNLVGITEAVSKRLFGARWPNDRNTNASTSPKCCKTGKNTPE